MLHRLLPLACCLLAVAAQPARTELSPTAAVELNPELTPEIVVEPDANNVTAGRLAGRWEADPLVGERLGTRAGCETLEFAVDAKVVAAVPARMAERLADFQVFEAGTLTRRDPAGEVVSSAPYLLIAMFGNPHVVWFRERDGEPLADAESANLFVAQGKSRDKDLLLFGGDFNNQPFQAWRRVAE